MPPPNRQARWTHEWILYLNAGILFGSAVLRSLLAFRGSSSITTVLALQTAALALFAIERILSPKLPAVFPIYVFLQTALIMALLFTPGISDYFAILFAVLGMQIMQRFSPKNGMLWIALFSPLMFIPLMKNYGLSKAVPFTVIYSALGAFLAAYSLATRRAQQARTQTQTLAQELREANTRLQSHSRRLERLAVSRERNRLARELHDSVTQTIFSMTLTTQSALMLLDRDASQVDGQLQRLYQLAQSAMSEMHMLISELRPDRVGEGGLPAAISRYLTDGHLSETLAVSLEVEGGQRLDPAEEEILFRIVQEALNNVVKHAQTHQAQIRLHLNEPRWIEIQDHGRGFDQDAVRDSNKIGLTGMRERADEIGWRLRVAASPGQGTCIRVTKMSPRERQA